MLDRQIGPDVGSDHLPVIVDLVVPVMPRGRVTTAQA